MGKIDTDRVWSPCPYEIICSSTSIQSNRTFTGVMHFLFLGKLSTLCPSTPNLKSIFAISANTLVGLAKIGDPIGGFLTTEFASSPAFIGWVGRLLTRLGEDF